MKIYLLLRLLLLPDRMLRNIFKRYYPIDRWLRYTAVIKFLEQIGNNMIMSVLDVGGGDGLFKLFLSSIYIYWLIDKDNNAIKKAVKKNINALVGNAYKLPFDDNSFDIVISVDSLEHTTNKVLYCEELKRVTRKAVILHCPLDSQDNNFQGTIYNRKYYNWYLAKFKKEEINTKEHLLMGLPTLEEITTLFPGVIIIPQQNCRIWLLLMQIKAIPYIGILTTIIYKLFLKKNDNVAPYHASLFCWNKNSLQNIDFTA